MPLEGRAYVHPQSHPHTSPRRTSGSRLRGTNVQTTKQQTHQGHAQYPHQRSNSSRRGQHRSDAIDPDRQSAPPASPKRGRQKVCGTQCCLGGNWRFSGGNQNRSDDSKSPSPDARGRVLIDCRGTRSGVPRDYKTFLAGTSGRHSLAFSFARNRRGTPFMNGVVRGILYGLGLSRRSK